MKTKLLYSTILFILVMAACSPLGTPLSPAPDPTQPAPVSGVAVVQSIEVQIQENSPMQVNVVVRGQLPDNGCTRIASVEQVRDGNRFHLTLKTATDPLALCAPALTPFEQVVALDVNGLPPARYFVEANGIEESLVLLTRNLSLFNQQLVEALNLHDFELLRLMMDESLVIAFWGSEGTTHEVEAAIEQLRLNYLNENAAILADPAKNLIELLGGVDPRTILGPGGSQNQVNALFVSGWGLDGKDEAILFVAPRPDGSLYWHTVLVAKGGFARLVPVTGPNPPVDTNAYATNVQYVMAQQDTAIYSGPDASFTEIGKLYYGQIAVVTGTNLNGAWWRILCPDNTVGSCWVSADRSLTQSVTLPHTGGPAPDTEDIPTITIVEVVEDETVTIKTHNFPASTKFYVRMGEMGTKGIDGILVDTINSGTGGSFLITFEIPRKFYGEAQIAIRLESNNGYFSYNWFENADHGDAPDQGDALPTTVKYVLALDTLVIRRGPGSEYRAIGSVAPGQISRVTGISRDGDWWKIVCPEGKSGSCWLSANPKYTEPSDGTPPAPAQPTKVKFIVALRNVSMHSGPANKYGILGSLASGQVVKVTGASANGKWWQIACPDGNSGHCWVSADPALTKPANPSGKADVQNVEIRVLESYPIRVRAIARGQLPDSGCTTISGARQTRKGNTFHVTVKTKTDPLAFCAPALTPFEQVIDLDVSSLLPGRYIVNVNGVKASFVLPESVPPAE